MPSTYDLSLPRWAARTQSGDARFAAARSRELAERLTPGHSSESGALIGAGVPARAGDAVPAHLPWLTPLRDRRGTRRLRAARSSAGPRARRGGQAPRGSPRRR
ncbi:hypothetical protein Acsp05_02650 [Actinokineospora sp. NBRC 105648]|nr:hypothetical protein Acsp05_02650 [Actinokineospora sp. NBRC 105648]